MPLKIRALYFAGWFLVVLITFAVMRVLPTLAYALWFALFYLLITVPARTLRLSSFAVFFFVGLLVVSHATLIVQMIVGLALPPIWSNDGKFVHYVLLAPITEEVAKLIAVALVLLVWKQSGARIAYGATDLMLVGLALGVGLNVFEDMFIPNSSARTVNLITSVFVPWTEVNVLRGRPDIVTINHAASTAFLGLALGWSRYLPKLVRYVPVLGVFLWMIWTHAMFNGQDLLERGNWAFLTAPLMWITPWVFFLAVVATIVFEGIILRVRVTEIEKQYGARVAQLRGRAWLRWFDAASLLRRLAYARVWLRGNPQDRESATKMVRKLVVRLENKLAA